MLLVQSMYCAILAGAVGGNDASSAWHPYFERTIEAHRDDGRSLLAINGQPLPHRFVVPVGTPHFWLDEADPIEFVLVLPGDVVVDGVTLPLRTPFYISTTELSNGQFAQLRHIGVMRAFDELASEVGLRARLDPDVRGCDIDRIVEYHGDPRRPAVGVDLIDAAVVSRMLGSITTMRVRLPSIGEWFRAMRAELPTPYWWEGEESLADRQPREGINPWPLSCEILRELTPVDVGEANPLGLKNMLGNVAELVSPSDAERAILRERFGPHAPLAANPRDLGERLSLGPHSALALGGSAQTRRGVANLDVDELVSKWTGLLGWSNIEERAPLCYHVQWCTGMRLVIDIPLGEWAVVEAPPGEGGDGPE